MSFFFSFPYGAPRYGVGHLFCAEKKFKKIAKKFKKSLDKFKTLWYNIDNEREINPNKTEGKKMKTSEYKKVKQEIEMYISKGHPLTAQNVHMQHSLKFSFKQYYELQDIICAAMKAAEPTL